jgi:hypothetical protein
MSDDPVKKADMSYKRNKDDRVAHCKGRKAVERFTNFTQGHIIVPRNFEFAFGDARLGAATPSNDTPTSLKGTSSTL